MRHLRTQRRKSGFTLLELLMVVVIIAILASIALPQYIRASEKSRATEALTALGAIRASELRYKAQNTLGNYSGPVANALAELDMSVGDAAGNLVSWNTLTVTTTAAGAAAPATGFVQYTRNGGEFATKVLGIQLGTGTLCGDFPPLGLPAACAED